MVHNVTDLKNGDSGKLVVKASHDIVMLFNETQTLEQVHEFAKKSIQYQQVIKQIPKSIFHCMVMLEVNESNQKDIP